MTAATIDLDLPLLGEGNPGEPPVKYHEIDGLPDNMLQYVGGPRDGGITPSSADYTSFTDQFERVHHYHKGLSPSGRICYLYDDYQWGAL